jgi:3-hydroxyanthranilate 3,4-dioxygenase
MCLVPALTPHSPHRPVDTWGLVIEVKRGATQTESLLWLCDTCDARLHEVTVHVADIEKELRTAIERCARASAAATSNPTARRFPRPCRR